MGLKGKLKSGVFALGMLWVGNGGYNMYQVHQETEALKCSEVSDLAREYLGKYALLDNFNNRKWLNEDGKEKFVELRDQLLPNQVNLLDECRQKEDPIIKQRVNRALLFNDFNFPLKTHERTVTYYE